MAATGTKFDTMIENPGVNGLGREWISFVLGVSGLATNLALSLTIGRRRLGRLDDIRRRRLGRCPGILPRRRELLLESSDCGLERRKSPLLSFQLRTQSRAILTRLPCLGFHGSLCYVTGSNFAIAVPVNGYIEDVRVGFDSQRSWSDSDLGPGETDHRTDGGSDLRSPVKEITANESQLAAETIR
jgi:hypothetical protein